MTMVQKLRSRTNNTLRRVRSARVAGVVVLCLLAGIGGASKVAADPPPVHYHHGGIMPPGAIGTQQLQRGGPLPGYFQPVEIRGPEGARIAPAVGGGFGEPRRDVLTAGMLIGAVYRLRVTDIPHHEGVEVYPTIEVIDRIYPPLGQEFRFPIPIELAPEELEMAAAGKFVTRVIYLEDPDRATPVAREGNEQAYFEVRAGDNPLDVADSLGRPVAILRLGARVPDASGPDEVFLYGCPPLVLWNPRPAQTQPVFLDGPQARLAHPQGRAQRASAIETTPSLKRQAVTR